MRILKDNESPLRSIAEEVPHGEDVKTLVNDMRKTMIEAGGIGLAANQVGILKRIIVLKTPKFKGAIINPMITNNTKDRINSNEGCLSFPGLIVDRKRFNKITVEGFDENWKPIKVNVNGLSSFCLQHEIDHLNGIVIGDEQNVR